MRITAETPADQWEVENLFDLCFAPGRSALSSYRLREGVPPVADLCLVARDDGGILGGAIRHWPVRVGQDRALLLGPVAVHPTRQGEGLAAQLIGSSVDRGRALGWERMLLVGDAPYYGRFGFERLPGIVMPPPTNPDRVLGLPLVLGGWDGMAGDVTRDMD
jgi:predicted N-acetyltransferase YhbS